MSFLLIAFAYLIGSISSAIVVCRALGLPDPRTQGSKNPGATNVLRLSGKKAAIITLTGDLLKGLLPLLLGKWWAVDELSLAAIGLAAFLGHLYPIFFGFQGGKGVATYIGVLFGFAWPAGLAFMLIWVSVAALFRYSSLAALIAASVSPLVLVWLGSGPAILLAGMTMVALLLWRHQSNIRNLLAGKESKIGAKSGAKDSLPSTSE
jgi:glycerol-3-phosphate acyltransferase PlsY